MLFCCTFYLQMPLMWLITPTHWLLAGGRKIEAIFRFSPPHLFPQRTSPFPPSEKVSRGVYFRSCVYPESCCIRRCFSAISCSLLTLLCLSTWELSLSASLKSLRTELLTEAAVQLITFSTHVFLRPLPSCVCRTGEKRNSVINVSLIYEQLRRS